jgi:hypothetical protein
MSHKRHRLLFLAGRFPELLGYVNPLNIRRRERVLFALPSLVHFFSSYLLVPQTTLCVITRKFQVYNFYSGKPKTFYDVIFSHQKMTQTFNFLSKLKVFQNLSFILSLVISEETLFLLKNFLFTPLLLRTRVTECLTSRIRPFITFFQGCPTHIGDRSHSRINQFHPPPHYVSLTPIFIVYSYVLLS